MAYSTSSRVVRSLSVVAVSALLSSVAFANGATWIVDTSGGAGFNFTDIPPAIAVAQPNDCVIVRAGTYSNFVLDKPLLVRGAAGARVPGVVRIQGLPANTRCALSNLEIGHVEVDGCAGGVVLEELRSTPFGTPFVAPLLVQNSADVRMRACDFEPYFAPDGAGFSAVYASAASLEVVQSNLRGQHGEGFPFNFALTPGRGGAALFAWNASTISVANSQLLGGGGGWADFGRGEDGGAACDLNNGSRARLAASTLTGGDGGAGSSGGCGSTFGDGRGGAAVRSVSTSLASHSALSATGGWGWDCGQAAPFLTQSGGQILFAAPSSPTLSLVTVSGAGTVTLRLRAPAGAGARAWLGRTMIAPTPGTEIVGQLTHRARIQNLGVVPGSGQVDAVFTLPTSVEAGDLVIAQADVVTAGGAILYSNSVCFTRP